jgi:ATP-dependent helicase/nuclease subunit A
MKAVGTITDTEQAQIPTNRAERRWSLAQRAAIDMRGQNLLVSASAGSGKTAVLIERALALLREGVNLSEMLIVTYTKAAASEMRERLFDALTHAAEESERCDNDHIINQAALIETADIRTLHSFCGQLLKGHFQAADVDPMYRVLDPVQGAALRAQAMDQALIEWYERHRVTMHSSIFTVDDEARALTECLPPSDLAELIDQLYNFLMARPEPWEWLHNSLESIPESAESLANSEMVRLLLIATADKLDDAMERAQALTKNCVQMNEWNAFIQTSQADEDAIRVISRAAKKGYNEYRDALKAHAWVRRAKAPKGLDKSIIEAYAERRDLVKKAFKKAADAVVYTAPLSAHARDLCVMRGEMAVLSEAARLFDSHYTALKDEHGALDYNDLEQRALRALNDPMVAESLRAQYAHIFVDEYQDSTPLQEALLTKIARGNNMFFVGDVKQSIYRFRDAEPGLFLDKYKRFRYVDASLAEQLRENDDSTADSRIDLDRNFRSSKAILQAVNDVFSRIQRASAFEIDYDERARMKPGRDVEGDPVEVNILIKDAESRIESIVPSDDNDGDEDPSDSDDGEVREELVLKDIEREAHLAAQKIQQLIREEEIQYSDIVILLRATTGRAIRVQDVFREYEIPAQTNDAEDFFEQLEVRQAIDLLAVIDNPRQDVPLIGALRGPVLGLLEPDMARIRLAKPKGTFYDALILASNEDSQLGEELRGFMTAIEDARFRSRMQPIHEMIGSIFDQTNLYANAGAKPNGAARQANLRQLLTRAEQYQRERGGGLHSFLLALREQQEDGSTQAQDDSTSTNSVRIMSIHKSKGLQFNTVFILGLGTQFNRRDEQKSLLTHARLGVSLRIFNPDDMTAKPTLAASAIRAAMQREMLAEEMRILYVGMTRAQDRLFMYGSTTWLDWMGESTNEESSDSVLLHAMAPIEWILRGIPREPLNGGVSSELMPGESYALPVRHPWRLLAHDPIMVLSKIPAKISVEHDTVIEAEPNPIAETFDTTPYFLILDEQKLIPYKQSVTQRIRASENSTDALAERPRFIQSNDRPTAAESGTVLHAILSHVDIHEMRTGSVLTVLDSTISRLLCDGILADAQVNAVNLQPLYLFYTSEIGRRLIAADEVHREWAFNLLDENRLTLVQGVIDCAFMTEDGWVLIDYKSDHKSDVNALIDRYKPQIQMYADALQQITGRPVCERILYMLSYNKAFRIS